MSVASIPAKNCTVFINGRFLSQRASGVQRFARELIKALDLVLPAQDGAPSDRKWVLLVPTNATDLPVLHNIEVREVGGPAGQLFDQWIRLQGKRGDIFVNLANSGPVLRGRSISILHDAAVYRTPRNFKFAYRTFHKLLGHLLAKRSLIGTVSQFSRRELAEVLHLDPARIFVVPNSCEHLRNVTSDGSVLSRLQLLPQKYFLFIGSPVPNKNLATAIEAFQKLKGSGHNFVIVGAVDSAVFGQGIQAASEGIIRTGAISDEQIKALLGHARALIFPSIYEGFGIPPLEAMSNRCPVIASRIAPVLEVCGEAALYFDPLDSADLAKVMQATIADPGLLEPLVALGEARASQFSWRTSAHCLLDAVKSID